MALLSEIITAISSVLDDPVAYPEPTLITYINDAVQQIAEGVSMPDAHRKYPGMQSPLLPDLFEIGTVTATASSPHCDMPDSHMARHGSLKLVMDSNGDRINCPSGGDYYSFQLFMNRVWTKDLSETGSLTICCMKGNQLYYQGMEDKTLTIHHYRNPVAMTTGTDSPDGLPDGLGKRLIKHFVLKEIFGEGIEDGEDNRGSATGYHTAKFFEAMTNLIDFIGIDAEPIYFGSSHGSYDRRDDY